MATRHCFVMVHGIVPKREPCTHQQLYNDFWARLTAVEPDLKHRFAEVVGVEWGHQLDPNARSVRDDERLTYAQQEIYDRSAYTVTSRRPGSHNAIMPDIGIPILHQVVSNLRENLLIFGVSDMIYYASADGECRVRQHVYGQVLSALERYKEHDDVRLHVFGHSLGVTVAHDFLFGLFNRKGTYKPGFIKDNQGRAQDQNRFLFWRHRAQIGRLSLGALLSAASQLPLLLQRSQTVVNILYQARLNEKFGMPVQLLDPSDIGIKPNAENQWKIFYDTDDLLAYPTSGLYSLPDGQRHPAIKDCQVNCGWMPTSAHEGYWVNEKVIRECAKSLMGWSG